MTSGTAHSGIDLSFVDAGTRAQDDLYAHFNGRWLAEHEIPADRAMDGVFRALYDQAELDVRQIITDAADTTAEPGTDAQRIGDLFRSFMDEDTIEALGITPITGELSAVVDAADRTELAHVLGELQHAGIGGAVSSYVNTDAKNSTRYLMYLSQSGIGLPDEAYYRADEHAETRAAYVEHISKMFALTGLHYDAQRVLDLETKLASHHWDVVKRRDAELSYNLSSIAGLTGDHSGFDWAGWATAFAGSIEPFREVVIRQPSFVAGFAELWASEPLDDWKAWAAWRVVNGRATELTAEIVAEHFAFYGTRLTGAPQNRERWKRGVATVEAGLGEAVGKLYVDKHFPEVAKQRMVELVGNLREAYRQSISSLEWMGPETREAALAKLEKFTPKVGYPDKWRDYSALEIKADDLVGNARRIAAFESDYNLSKLGGPVDRDEWFMTPQTVNAYYNPGMNEIVFPAAILQPPFFDLEADDAANYGAIGAVIGHEIGHGFDDQGAKYDGDGNLVDWWTDSDREEFGKRTKALIAQYDAFSPKQLPDHKVNGAFTVGENIGDLGGLTIGLKAYEIALNGDKAPVLDGLTGLQRVFFSWAQVWRAKGRDEEVLRRLSVDPHSPPEFRCNGVVRNLDAFHEAFGVAEGDALYLPEDERITIW
ncbi:M13 family metallopeptidase [Smaragdicoccus niigatensis]|uniref:M13 family metallopeptidase n=1 Tax=Smaragdicoccus niigatensis TaxID=359359 RepID=UPI0003720610